MNKPTRGLRSDGEVTRTRILEAAGELFATTGYAETSNKAIASQAEVDLASINYHFGNRSGLYQAVLAVAHGRLLDMAALQQLTSSELSPASKLRVLIEQLVERATQEPQTWPLRVLAREVLSPTSHLQILFQDQAQPKITLLKHMLGEITQIPPGDPALARCLLNVITPCLMLLVGGRNFPGPLQEIFQMPSQAIANHLYHFAIGGLEAISREYVKQAEFRGKSGCDEVTR
uniref:Putative members of the TetR/AcrR family protein n=2 Tax=Stutzerimonas TaxID=2901164 RepID=Q84IQ5_STUST|nr:putative members of the TetR/AcrR family protein [Stutzerimonas stutzeri]